MGRDAAAGVLLYDARGEALVLESAPSGPERRGDRWENYRTGIGTGGDKVTAGRFFPVWRIFDNELTNLNNGSDLAAKVVQKRPAEMFRRGYELACDDLDADDIKTLREHAEEVLRVDEQCEEAAIWGRLYGGDLLLLGCDDGGEPWEPLNEKAIRTFGYINQVDRRFAFAQTYYADPLSPKYGLPETYLISNGVAGLRFGPSIKKPTPRELMSQGWAVNIIHETRLIRWGGNPVDVVTRQQLAGWDWSVLQRVYDQMRGFEHAFDSVGYLLADASQAVFKLQGLIDAISAGRREEVAARVALIEETRSVMHGVLLDANGNESFERTQTPFGGVADVLDRWMLRFAAAADMPATELFGRSAAGLNATGENDTRKWYDTISTEQGKFLGPKLRRIFRLVCLSADSPIGRKDVRFEVNFKPLWAPTDAEGADTKLKVAQTDQIYLGEGVVTPEEVALDRSDLYPSMDLEARKTAMAGAKEFDPYENEPDDPTAIAQREMGQPQGPGVPVPIPGAPQAAGALGPRATGGKPAPTPKGPQKVKDREDAATTMQALVFAKLHFDRERVKEWCDKAGKPCAVVRDTEKSIRVRQESPARFEAASLRTIDLAPGVRAIVGRLKPQSPKGK